MKEIPVAYTFVHYHWIEIEHDRDGKIPGNKLVGPNDFMVASPRDIYFRGTGNVGRLLANGLMGGILGIKYQVYLHLPDQVLYEVFEHDFIHPVRILRDRLITHGEQAIRWFTARDVFPRADLGEFVNFPIAQFVC